MYLSIKKSSIYIEIATFQLLWRLDIEQAIAVRENVAWERLNAKCSNALNMASTYPLAHNMYMSMKNLENSYLNA